MADRVYTALTTTNITVARGSTPQESKPLSAKRAREFIQNFFNLMLGTIKNRVVALVRDVERFRHGADARTEEGDNIPRLLQEFYTSLTEVIGLEKCSTLRSLEYYI